MEDKDIAGTHITPVLVGELAGVGLHHLQRTMCQWVRVCVCVCVLPSVDTLMPPGVCVYNNANCTQERIGFPGLDDGLRPPDAGNATSCAHFW